MERIMRIETKAQTLICVLCASCVFASAIFAQDAPDEAFRQSAPAPIWTGAYVGAHGGASFDRGTLDVPGGHISESETTGVGGLYGGYNWQSGHWVMGAEVDWTAGSLHNSRDLITVRGRLGYAFDRTLVYGTVGWGTQDTSVYRFDGAVLQAINKRANGIAVGGGVESWLTPRLSLRGEVIYFDAFEQDFDFPATNLAPSASVTQDFSHTLVRAGLTLHFN